jgi:alanine-alpha-ketoisovalerate/valine-pyruvate aminotransferase
MNESKKLLPSTLFDSNESNGKWRLNIGAPGPLTLRKVGILMRDATNKRLVNDVQLFIYIFIQNDEINGDSELMQYGAPQGDPRFISALAQFLTKQYQQEVSMYICSSNSTLI